MGSILLSWPFTSASCVMGSIHLAIDAGSILRILVSSPRARAKVSACTSLPKFPWERIQVSLRLNMNRHNRGMRRFWCVNICACLLLHKVVILLGHLEESHCENRCFFMDLEYPFSVSSTVFAWCTGTWCIWTVNSIQRLAPFRVTVAQTIRLIPRACRLTLMKSTSSSQRNSVP